jgi:hypothetical protein
MSKAKDYLQTIADLDERIDMMESEKSDLKDRLQHITPTLSFDKGSGGGGQQDKMASAIARIVDLQKLIDDHVDEYIDKKKEALELLDKMENPTYMTVLHRRYFLHHTFERIASDMNFTYRWVCVLHGRALQEFDKVMPAGKT